MLAWLMENLGTILISLGLVAVVVVIILSLRKRKKKGKASCCGNYAHCAMCEACRKKEAGQ